MKRLAVIPSENISQYISKGHTASKLASYYNPGRFFEKVYLLSPREEDNPDLLGMEVIKTKPTELQRRIKGLNIDVVRAYGGYWACNMACNYKVNNVPVIVSVHDSRIGRLYDSIRKADVVFCMSDIVKRTVMRKYMNTDNIWVIPNRVDFDVMYKRPGKEIRDLQIKYPYKFKILHVGRKVYEKNLDTLIHAVKLLGDDYGLVAVGPGDRERYMNMAYELNVQEQCHFLDAVDQAELSRYYSWADCMCTPSRSEGFGIVFIEALACSSVVITSDIAPMNEYIKDGKNGILIKDYECPSCLARAIRYVCNNDYLRSVLGEAARESVKKFEKSRIDKLEASYYQKVLTMRDEGKFAVPYYVHALWDMETMVKDRLPSGLREKIRNYLTAKTSNA
jgi:glycosyltransferase involved in cell wall biosynthesis